ncbi:MAG: HdeD family acid-resistance protein [Streptosporangiaceae bacterium]
MTEPVQQPADMLTRLGRKWGWVLAYGIITLAAGVAVLVWPGETLLVMAVLFGIQLIVSGIFRFVAALAVDDLAGGTRVLLALLAVLSIIVGLWAVRHVTLTLLALAVLLGIFWVVNGAIELSPRSATAACPSGAGPYSWGCSASSPASSCSPTRA